MTDQPHAQEEPQPEGKAPGEKWFDSTWTRVHPFSPIVQGWVTFIAIPVAILGYNWEVITYIFNAIRSGELIEDIQRNTQVYLLGGAGVVLLFLLILGGAFLSWWFTRYKITDEHVMVKSGVFFRQHRQARIDRVQAVDLRQPLLARITGLAELKFEVAEGDGTAATLAFLKKRQAEQLRTEIMDRASGRTQWHQHSEQQQALQQPDQGQQHQYDHVAAAADVPVGHQDPHAATQEQHAQHGHPVPPEHSASQHPAPGGPTKPPERLIVKVPIKRLLLSVLAGPGTVVLVILAIGALLAFSAMAVAFAAFGDASFFESELWQGIRIPMLIPVLFGAAVTYYSSIAAGFRFTATMTQAGLRLKYGLTETTSQTVPPGRIQALEVIQPLFWRPFGWYRIRVTVAGYGVDSRSQLLPVGTRQDVMNITAEMFPDLKVPNPEELFAHGLLGSGTGLGFTQVPSQARIFDPLVHRRRGFFATESVLMLRDGVLTRRLAMVPHERIQSLSKEQGPLARWRGVANLLIHVPAGPVTSRVLNQDAEAIAWLFEAESAHAAVARRMSDRNQWMMPEELAEFDRMVAGLEQDPQGIGQDTVPGSHQEPAAQPGQHAMVQASPQSAEQPGPYSVGPQPEPQHHAPRPTGEDRSNSGD